MRLFVKMAGRLQFSSLSAGSLVLVIKCFSDQEGKYGSAEFISFSFYYESIFRLLTFSLLLVDAIFYPHVKTLAISLYLLSKISFMLTYENRL